MGHNSNIRAILADRGIDVEDPNFVGTPKRWLKYIESFTQPYDATEDLSITFPLKGNMDPDSGAGVFDRSMVVQTNIPYVAVCAHHLLPVIGQAHVAYIPKNSAVGLSKLSRLVRGISHMEPSLQEDVCHQITDALMKHLDPLGAACLITAEHGCMSARGVEQAGNGVRTVTTSLKGVFIKNVEARNEFYRMIQHS